MTGDEVDDDLQTGCHRKRADQYQARAEGADTGEEEISDQDGEDGDEGVSPPEEGESEGYADEDGYDKLQFVGVAN
ncbi:MAG: hypothetical protein DYG85_10345 [Chloroflexi bacterium CFX1]|nr:hypothetical protein [Chloroflexi bacterium CFX1]